MAVAFGYSEKSPESSGIEELRVKINLTVNTGIYCLCIKLLQGHYIKVGCLGTFYFPPGFYIYVGSAQNGLERRIQRHVRRKKKVRWHIDYLLQYGQVVSAHTYGGEKDKECVVSHEIGNMEDAVVPVKGFGSSDCFCASHLYFFQDDPDFWISRLKIT